MKPLHPNQIWVLRIRGAIVALMMVAAIAVADATWLAATLAPQGAATGAAVLAAVLLLFWMPRRRYRAWGYMLGEDELHIRHGVWTRLRTAVPFGRVQHIDVSQGPIERPFGLGTLILHTAGTRSAALALPGLPLADAERMRDIIRAKIRQDLA